MDFDYIFCTFGSVYGSKKSTTADNSKFWTVGINAKSGQLDCCEFDKYPSTAFGNSRLTEKKQENEI